MDVKGGPRKRLQKRRMHGGELAAPAYPTVQSTKESWKKLIEKGDLSLGIPCAPFELTHFTVADGELKKNHTVVTGRKFPLKEIREKTLSQQEKFMRLNSDEEIDGMTDEELASRLSLLSIDFSGDKRESLKRSQRSRSLALWHDHGTVLGLGVVMITVHTVYDPAVFFTQTEMDTGVDIQATVETPIVHLLVACSSTVDDQAPIVQDRIDCLYTLSEPVTSSGGIAINDQLLFFVGDHPAKQFERGTQGGGRYKCGGCGVRDTMMDDLAHTLQLPRRSLAKLQQLAISGKWGRIPGKLKPFDGLKVQQLKAELIARGVANTDRRKPEMEHILKEILQVSNLHIIFWAPA